MRVTTYINIANIGLVGENYETANLEYCDVEILRRAVDRHRDLVLGVKVRIGTPTVGDTGVESLRRAVQAGEECELPVMVHIAMGPPSIDDVLDLLRPGDICTHSFTGLTMKIVDDEGRLRESARRALDRGVLLDIGHGTGSFAFTSAEALLGQGVEPDTISTDMHQQSIYGPMFDLPTTMTKFLHLGMPLPDVVRAPRPRGRQSCSGWTREVGTLGPGARADVGLFTLLEGEFPLYDIAGEMRVSRTPAPQHADDPRRARARSARAGAAGVLDGADLARRPARLHREAAAAARPRAHARRDGRAVRARAGGDPGMSELALPGTINRDSPIPFYFQLSELLEDEISSGRWESGQRIPSEPDLCDHYGVSRTTVRQALARLEQEGLVARSKGRGTFVLGQRPRSWLIQTTEGFFHEEFLRTGHRVTSKVLRRERDARFRTGRPTRSTCPTRAGASSSSACARSTGWSPSTCSTTCPTRSPTSSWA